MAPAVETVPNLNDGLNGDNASTKPVVGIIYPPPEVRNIVDKTAAFVARNGPEFEARIRQNEINNPKFNFLNVGDPYHAYYQYKVKEIREGNPPDSTPVPAAPQAPARPVLGPPPSVPAAQFQKQQEILKQVQQDIPQVPKEPPPEFEFIVDPPSISAMELDIVKLTAQFVARNGRQFLTSLMNREARNYQFDFLRPQHSLFQYFTRLLEQYTKVLIPPKDLMAKLREESSNPSIVLEQVKKRADWQRHQEAKKRREEEIAEKERISYAQIDWHDFVVVETVDYQPFELGNFPPPTNPESVGARVLLQERYEDGQDVEMQLESDEEGGKEAEESESEEEVAPVRPAAPPPPPPPAKPAEMAPPPLPPAPENVIVRKDYNPKAAPRPQARPPAPDEYLISPITGERIPASQVAEHMRIGLLDPRWVEQRDRQLQEKMAQESVYAPGSAIESSLRQLAERRTDIFGVGAEETAIGKKIGEEERRRDDKPWEGPTTDAAQRNTISIQDQIAQIHKSKGLVSEDQQRIGPKPSDDENKPGVVASAPPKPPSATPAAPLPPPPAPVMNIPRPVAAPTVILTPQPPIMMVPIAPPAPIVVAPSPFGFVPQQPMGVQPAPPVSMMQVPHVPHVAPEPVHHADGEPPAKRVRSEDQLMPEEAFLVRYPGPLKFHVAVPLVNDKSGWKLQGQQLDYSLPPTETIASVKAKIQEATGLPPAKQKLVWEGLYFKDQFSLAYYNVMPDGVIQLQVKERGGRKK